MAVRRKHSFWFPLLGLGFAVAGADKILGVRGYENLFRRWGWRTGIMRVVGLGEFLGGVLVASRRHRRQGGMLLTAASTAILTKEASRPDTGLAAPRLALLLASVAALIAGDSRRQPRARPQKSAWS
jgi:hypothetical protein